MLKHRDTRATQRPRGAGDAGRFLAKAVGHRTAGRFDKARHTLKLVLDAEPHHADAHFEMGLIAVAAGTPEPAVQHFVVALRGAPDRPAYWLALSRMLVDSGRLREARALMEQFKAQDLPAEGIGLALTSFVEHAYAKARAAYDADDLVHAEALLDLVLAFDETHADATYYAGAIAARTNRMQQAYDLLSIAILRDNASAAYFCTFGVLLSTMGDLPGAISALEKALALDPDLAIAHSNLAGVFLKSNRFGDCYAHVRQALALDPGHAGAHVNLGVCLKSLGDLPGAIAAYDTALALDPGHMYAHSNRLFAKLYATDVSPVDYARDARAFAARFADPLLRQRAFGNDRDPDRPLRIGIVSGDLYRHAVARFLEPVLRHLDRTRFHLRAYMTRSLEDGVSEQLRPLFDGWTNVSGLNDDEAADLIEADAIDILVDLSGHSAGHRLLVFARKPAPVQATWIGHPATTGLAAIDYRLTDAIHDPKGLTEAFHTETLWRLPGVSATYQLPPVLPALRDRAPFEERGYVTFGVLNRFEKAGDLALAAWARIMREMPDARLFMVVGDVDRPEIRERIEARLSRAGMPLERVRLHPRVTSGYFELYHEIDIALDPFPYNGGTTSCDTLCMGVPFIALTGGHTVARTGLAALSAVGLEELAATTPEGYVDRALALARDPERLRAIRSSLRERMLASPLMDSERLAREVGEAFRAMWRRWAESGNRA